MSRISQREARRNRKEVARLRDVIYRQRKAWSAEYLGGIEIHRHKFDNSWASEVVRTARKLGHAVVVIGDDSETLRFVALPHPKETI